MWAIEKEKHNRYKSIFIITCDEIHLEYNG